MRRWLRRLSLGLLLLTGLAGALWLARDVPRRQLERALSGKLGARVRVGSLRILGPERFTIDDLEVRRLPSLPQLESLTVARVEADGPPWRLAQGRCERLRLDGLDVVLAPSRGRIDLSGAFLEAGLLEVKRGRVELRGAGGTTDFTLEARIQDFGRTPKGEVRLAGPRLDAASVLALVDGGAALPVGVSLAGVAAELRLEPGGRMRLNAEARRATLRRDDRSLALDRPRLEAVVAMGADRMVVTLAPTLSGVGPARAELTFGVTPTRLDHVDVRVAAVQLGPWLALLPPLPGGVGIDGQVDLEVSGSPATGLRARVTLPSARVETPVGRVTATARLVTTLAGEGNVVHGPVEADVELRPNGDGPIRDLLPARLSAVGKASVGERTGFAGRVSVVTGTAGSVVADGTVTAGDQASFDLAWRWEGGDLTRLASLAAASGVSALPAGIEVEGKASARGTLAGSLPQPSATATFTVEGATVRSNTRDGGWSVEVPRATATLAARSANHPVTISLPVTTAVLRLPPLGAVDLSVSAEGELEPAAGTAQVRRLELSAPALGRATATASLDRSGPLLGHLRLELPDLGRVRSALRPLLPSLPDELGVSGSASADLALDASPDGRWSAAGPLTLAKAGFASSDGSHVLEGLSAGLDFEARGTAASLHVRATGSTGGFQLLWGTLFGDWSQIEARLELGLDADRANAVAAWNWTVAGSVSPPGGLHLGATLGTAPGRALAWNAELTADDLGAVLERSLRPPLGGSVPALEALSAHGSVAAHLAGTLGEGAGSAGGELRLSGVELAGNGVEVRGLDAELPLELTWSRGGPTGPLAVSGQRRTGSLRFGGITASGVTIAATSASLVVDGDTVTLGSSLVLPLLGGDIELGGLSLVDLIRPDRQLETSVQLHAISLAELSSALGLPPLDGALDGAFPRVHLTPATLTVDGTGRLMLFGGTVEVSHISGKDVLGRYPRLVFDARFSGIDLGRLTRAFDFGEVTGVLEGEVRDCELFRGMPVRFAAELRTVREPGVKQRISVKAVNNVAIFGTGSGIGALTSGLRRFISSYPYQAFGVAMRLEKDQFLLRGLEHRGDRELFLRGRLPFRLDVVNVQPGATVSFRTMVERLSHLDFSKVRTQP